jgi:hypothetical protein
MEKRKNPRFQTHKNPIKNRKKRRSSTRKYPKNYSPWPEKVPKPSDNYLLMVENIVFVDLTKIINKSQRKNKLH